jgi:hypothetical protein
MAASTRGRIPHFDDMDSSAVRAIVARALGRGPGWLTPVEAQALIQSVGVPVATARVSDDEEGAVAAARAIGYPIVLKTVGPALLHKTEAGAVRLGIEHEAALRASCRDMRNRLGLELTGFLVQQMVPGGVEMLVRADPGGHRIEDCWWAERTAPAGAPGWLGAWSTAWRCLRRPSPGIVLTDTCRKCPFWRPRTDSDDAGPPEGGDCASP